MTIVRVKGIKRYTHPVSRLTYVYDRKTGKRLHADVGSSVFFEELAAVRKAAERAKAIPGSLGLIISEYRCSPDWATLKPKTRVSYERVFVVLKKLEEMPVVRVDRPFLVRLRDEKLLPKHGRWLANYSLTVLSIVFRFACERGYIDKNPLAEKVRRIRAASDAPVRNRPWSPQECDIVVAHAPPQLALPIALAMCAGLRKADFLTVTMSAIVGDLITIKTSKRGVRVAVPIHPVLARAIAARPPSTAPQIAVNSYGEPWTETGFNASFRSFKQRLEERGLIEPGLTPHGLRHTLGTRLREAGADDRTIADILGQRSSSMARHYSENAKLPDRARELMAGLELTKNDADSKECLQTQHRVSTNREAIAEAIDFDGAQGRNRTTDTAIFSRVFSLVFIRASRLFAAKHARKYQWVRTPLQNIPARGRAARAAKKSRLPEALASCFISDPLYIGSDISLPRESPCLMRQSENQSASTPAPATRFPRCRLTSKTN